MLLVALTVAVTLTSVAAGGPTATKQRVTIETTGRDGTFTLEPLNAGPIERDSGSQSCTGRDVEGEVMRDGQHAFTHDCRAWTFVGKRGTLVVRSKFAWVSAGTYDVAPGTWKVVRGTGRYAGATGGGRNAHVGTATLWEATYEGFLVTP